MCLLEFRWGLMIGTCSGGPIYRTGSSTTRLAAINGCYELARGRVLIRSARFDLSRGKLLRKRSLSASRGLEKAFSQFQQQLLCLEFEIFQRVFDDFSKIYPRIKPWKYALWEQIFSLMCCPPCALHDFTKNLVKS